MSLAQAPLATAAPASLPDLVDGVALRTGAWVVVERFGAVVAHGVGRDACPAAVASALLGKTTAPLREAVTWSRGGRRLRGVVDDVALTAVDLGEGGTAWFVGADVDDAVLPLLSAALCDDGGPLTDPLVEALLHPRGPSRGTQAPQALLLVLTSPGPLRALARAAATALVGSAGRVHTEPDDVVLVLDPTQDARPLVELVRSRCPDAVAGAAPVADGAADWAATAAVARDAARAARRLGIALGHPGAPAVAAELVIDAARDAVADVARELPTTPLRRLEEHDARGSGELVGSLRAWCRAGFDVARAAAELHVHSNTLRYRIRRAGEISGLDLVDPRHVLALQLLLED